MRTNKTIQPESELVWTSKAPISIYNLHGARKVMEEDPDYPNLEQGLPYYSSPRVFYRRNMADGHLFMSEKELMTIITYLDPRIETWKDNTTYFQPHNRERLNKLRLVEFNARHIAIIYEADDVDEEEDDFIFMRIT